jgi:hypothetical protein
MQNEQPIGAWKLGSCEARSSSGEVSYPYGRNPFGMLVYDSDGNVFVLLMRRARLVSSKKEEKSESLNCFVMTS